MNIRFPLVAASVLAMAIAVPAMANDNNHKTPPGKPCAKDNGNPCNGNNGNDGAQGNAFRQQNNREHVKRDYDIPPFTISRIGSDHGAYIDQVGFDNDASITQDSSSAYARVGQVGVKNEATVTQQDGGAGYAVLGQAGYKNDAEITQSGGGDHVLYAIQLGAKNHMGATQDAPAGAGNGALLKQLGTNNEMSLTQQGGNNEAILAQVGDGNEMTATQTGDNHLIWTQVGDNLSDLTVIQPAGQSMQITQTK